jgi:hypothetical protein
MFRKELPFPGLLIAHRRGQIDGAVVVVVAFAQHRVRA